jgi:hypothetical protein
VSKRIIENRPLIRVALFGMARFPVAAHIGSSIGFTNRPRRQSRRKLP